VKDHSVGKLGESSESDKEGNEGRQEWLMRFSTMKVGPPKHARPITETKHLILGVRVTACRMMSRLDLKQRRGLRDFMSSH